MNPNREPLLFGLALLLVLATNAAEGANCSLREIRDVRFNPALSLTSTDSLPLYPKNHWPDHDLGNFSFHGKAGKEAPQYSATFGLALGMKAVATNGIGDLIEGLARDGADRNPNRLDERIHGFLRNHDDKPTRKFCELLKGRLFRKTGWLLFSRQQPQSKLLRDVIEPQEAESFQGREAAMILFLNKSTNPQLSTFDYRAACIFWSRAERNVEALPAWETQGYHYSHGKLDPTSCIHREDGTVLWKLHYVSQVEESKAHLIDRAWERITLHMYERLDSEGHKVSHYYGHGTDTLQTRGPLLIGKDTLIPICSRSNGLVALVVVSQFYAQKLEGDYRDFTGEFMKDNMFNLGKLAEEAATITNVNQLDTFLHPRAPAKKVK